MTAGLFALLVALGSVLGAAIATPTEEMNAVTCFVMINSIFAALAFGVVQTALEFFRSTSPHRS